MWLLHDYYCHQLVQNSSFDDLYVSWMSPTLSCELHARPALEGGQGRPWPPQLFITSFTIKKIKPSEIIRVIVINYGAQLVLDTISSSNKFCVSKTAHWIQNYCQRSLFDKLKFLHYDVNKDAIFCHMCIQAVQQQRL